MEWLSLLLAAVLFAAACNLDTVILSMGYAVKGVRVSLSHSLIIAALTTLITWASLLLGAGAARVLSGPLPNLLGGLVLAGIGAWFVLDWLRRLGPAGEAEGENRAATLWGCVSLAAALAVNNAGIGVAAGVSGIAPGWAALANFLVTLAALPLGRALGDKLAGRLLGKYALPLSGALLVLLAVPLGNAYIGNYLSIYGGMDTQSYVLLMQSAVTGFQILGGVLLGLFGAAYLFRRKP